MLYAAQLRAGRALLGWRQEDLAKAADIGLATLQRIESIEGPAKGHAGTIWKLQTALEGAGIRFIGGESSDPEIGVLRVLERPAAVPKALKSNKSPVPRPRGRT